MSSNYSNARPATHTVNTATTGPRAKCDQVVFEALCKACEIIVGSRTSITATAANSSRFNLQIPEVAGIRSILSQYRLQLHVPVRLDVYYQHPEGSRELLERWCLEYKTVSSERFLQVEGVVTNDPMVQLTHVCKRVVLWLRTLYCWTRLLPAHAVGANSKQIGFSIYVNSDYSDDVTELTANQGFLSQSRGNGVVTTPYGELAWQVLYCPPSKLERLMPTVRSVVRIQTPRSSSRPIPMAAKQQQQHVDARQQLQIAPHSAPSARPPTYTERSQQKRLEAAHQQQQLRQTGKSYDRSRLNQRSVASGKEQHAHPLALQRSHTSIGGQSPHQSLAVPLANNPPERVMSGLSLALMMASNDDDYSGENSMTRATHGGNNNNSNNEGDDDHAKHLGNSATLQDEEETAEEKARRAALHQMPPHLLEQASPLGAAAAMSGDYGYGYNNHIPWQKIHPSNSNPVQPHHPPSNSFGRTLSTSPSSVTLSPLHALQAPQTPSGAAFLGATPPIGNGPGHLIPPRNRAESKSITPPFQPRPAGFLHDAPTLHLEPQQYPSSRSFDSELNKERTPAVQKVPVTSLDSLRSSPFQQQQTLSLHPEGRSSMLSSLSFAPALGSDYSTNILTHSGTGDLRRSLWGGASGAVLPSSLAGSAGLQQHSLFQQQEDYYSEEMPFAVELPSSPAQFLFGGSHQRQSPSASKPSASSYLGNSSALASLAQKCAAPSHRLKLFEKQISDSTSGMEERGPSDVAAREDDLVNSLADQLQEFRAFGASLLGSVLDPNNVGEEQLPDSGTSSTSTPISLRS